MATFIKIASVTVGSGGAANIDFTSIPSTYTDLCIKLSARSNRAAEIDDFFIIKPNNSTSNLTYCFIRGNGTAVTSGTSGNLYIPAANSTSSSFSNSEIYVPNYAGNANKSMSVDTIEENNAAEAYMSLATVLWSDTTAISRVVLAPVFGTLFNQYSTATLYGISNA